MESGDFEQGQGTLCGEDGKWYCCIGVAAEVLGVLRKKPDTGTTYRAIKRHPSYTGALPPEILEKIGLEERAQSALIAENDTLGSSFAEIASAIRAGSIHGVQI